MNKLKFDKRDDINIYKILTIAELDCCQIIIVSIYVPYTHA